MRGGLTATDPADLELASAPQVGSAKDPVNMLGLIADNLAGDERTVQWHEVDNLIENGATLVDARTATEFADGAIPKAMNVPLDEPRTRAGDCHLRGRPTRARRGSAAGPAGPRRGQSGRRPADLGGRDPPVR